jgi:hypothetical protein
MVCLVAMFGFYMADRPLCAWLAPLLAAEAHYFLLGSKSNKKSSQADRGKTPGRGLTGLCASFLILI